MIRQRVDIRGGVRQMEAMDEIPCLKRKNIEIGLLREAPAKRWLTGQQEWDKRFENTAKKVERERKKLEAKFQATLSRAIELGLEYNDLPDDVSIHTIDEDLADGEGVIQGARRWGPLDLSAETPPPSAIAGRKDTVCCLFFNSYHMHLLNTDLARIACPSS